MGKLYGKSDLRRFGDTGDLETAIRRFKEDWPKSMNRPLSSFMQELTGAANMKDLMQIDYFDDEPQHARWRRDRV
jgi:hypothetical protein